MKKNLLLINFLFISFSAFSQQPGTADYLLIKNGFSIFKLGDTIANYSDYIKINPYYNGGDQIYELIDPGMLQLENDIKIKYLTLTVKQGLIESIDIVVEKEHKNALLKNLKTNYGEAKDTESTFWKTKGSKIILAYANQYKSTDMARVVFLHTDLATDRESSD
ncbi:MAG: hypothetical protein ACQPRJ_06205 [Solitalea-like symbiont of Acarus siro]